MAGGECFEAASLMGGKAGRQAEALRYRAVAWEVSLAGTSLLRSKRLGAAFLRRPVQRGNVLKSLQHDARTDGLGHDAG
jgi:hypothetical protein